MIQLINYFTQIWWEWMIGMFWQASLLIIIIYIIDLFIKKWAWPQVRYGLWLLILLKLIIPPSLSSNFSIISHLLPVEKSIDKKNNDERFLKYGKLDNVKNKSEIEFITERQVQNSVPDPTLQLSIPETKIKLNTKFYFLIIWLTGIFLFTTILITRMILLRHWHNEHDDHSIPAWFHQLLIKISTQMKLNRLPAIVFSNKAATPAVYGLIRPVLLLPVNYFNSLTKQEAEHILLHELCHLKRHDLIVHGICLILQILYWFNPLIIWARKQMQHVREICCDLSVASILREKTVEYRNTLLNTTKKLLTESLQPSLGLLGVFEEPFRLLQRLKWLEKNTWINIKKIQLFAFVSALLVFIFILPMSGATKTSLINFESTKDYKSIFTKIISDYYHAYASKDADLFLSFYSKKFKKRIENNCKGGIDEWKKHLESQVFLKWKTINITGEVTDVTQTGDAHIVTFIKNMNCTDWQDKEYKIEKVAKEYFSFKKENDDWKIILIKYTGFPDAYNNLDSHYKNIGKKGFAYVSHITHDFVSVIDIKTNKVVGKLNAGYGTVYINFINNEYTGYIVNFNSNDITIFNKKNNDIIETIKTKKAPNSIIFTANKKYAFISHGSGGYNSIEIMDLSKNKIVNEISDAYGFLYSYKQGKYFYQPQIFTPFLCIIEPLEQNIIKKIYIGGRPMQLAFTPDWDYAYITNYDLNTVQILELWGNVLIDNIENVVHPRGIAITPDGLYVVVTNVTQDSVTIINTTNNTIKTKIQVGKMPTFVDITSDNKYAYITNQGSRSISVIDIERLKVTDIIQVADNPIHIFIDK